MAKWRPQFEVEGIPVPIPDNYSQLIADLSTDDSGRTLDGVMHKDIISVKTTTPLSWSKLDWNTAAAICNAVDGKTALSIKYMDVRNPYTMSSGVIYVGDRNCQPISFTTDGKVYWSVSFDEIGV